MRCVLAFSAVLVIVTFFCSVVTVIWGGPALLRAFGPSRPHRDRGVPEVERREGILFATLHECDADAARVSEVSGVPFDDPAVAIRARDPGHERQLARCVSESFRKANGEVDAEVCLHDLAAYDRAAARRIARPSRTPGRVPRYDALVTTLTQLPSSGDLERELAALDLVGAPAAAPPLEPSVVDATDVLIARRRAYSFDAEALDIPVPYERLLATIAARAATKLSDVSFARLDPALPRRAGYRLVARFGDTCVTTSAAEADDWYDLDVVVGFLNAIEERRGSAERLRTLATTDSTAVVVAGAPAALVEAERRNLIALMNY